MGDLRRAPTDSFGQIDLDLDDEASGMTASPPASAMGAAAATGAAFPTAPPPAPAADESGRAFGEVDFDLGHDDWGAPPVDDEPSAPPPSTSRVFTSERIGPETSARNTPATRRNLEAVREAQHTEMTRVVSGDALSNITRPPPPMSETGAPPDEDGSTRAWAQIDDQLLAVARGESDEASPSQSGHQPAPSGSGVATRDGRVAAMRELYAKGDADGALALGATLGQSIAPAGSGVDHPDASIVVEIGEQSIDLDDPFGGLIPLDDELAAKMTAIPPPPAPAGAATFAPPAAAAAPTTPPPAPTAPPCAAPQLTLTERHSIPRLLKSMAEVSKLKIDHRAGFLLAHVDGMQTLEEILDICAMPSAEALDLFANLKTMGVIEFE